MQPDMDKVELSEAELNPSRALAWYLQTQGLDVVDVPERLSSNLAARIAQTSKQPIEAAEQQMRDLVAAAKQQYHEAGAVYGADLVGFIVWVSQRIPLWPIEPASEAE